MQAPPVPPDEAQRLAALRSLELLDTPAEERFDRITRIAQRLFNVPITLISLIDSERQWFKSRQGVDVSETSREISFCGHAILGDDIFEIPDALNDPRFADNPLVTGPPDLRFYAAAPLTGPEGYRVGTLCLIDRSPRHLDADQRQLLRDLGEQVKAEFGRTRLQEAIDALRTHEARMRAIFNTATDGIITIAENGMIESFNPAATGIFGYAPAEVIGRNVSLLMPEPHCSEHDGYITRFLTTREPHVIGTRLEMTGRHKAGTSFPMELSVSETVVGGRRFFTGIIRDITARKQAERIKKEFISTISHELRTPLTSIRGSLGLIAGGIAGPLPDQATKLIDVAHRNSERLVRLINDILDIDKIESGKMQLDLQTQPLLPLVHHAIEANRAYAREFQVGITLVSSETEALVRVDADRLNQAITNLLSNAAKFSPADTDIQVSVEHHSGVLRISVADRGPGVPEQFRDRIFEKFSQADASDTRQKGGTGLGLAITKSLIEAMGGRIGYDSAAPGTTFWFELPAIPRPDASPADNASDAPRILICEDDPDVALLIRYMLEHDGYRTDIACDAEQAREMLSSTHYDAMTLDIALPGQDGITLIRQLRSDVESRSLPIIVVSALAQEGRSLLGGGMAVADWLEKPIDRQHLLAAVRDRVADNAPSPKAEKRQRILHIEDDPDVHRFISALATELADFDHAPDLDSARRYLAAHAYDLIILDLNLPDGSGWELLPLISLQASRPRVVVFSASDVSRQHAQHFAACLVKSSTDNPTLLATLRAQIAPHPTPEDHQ
ncbi:response regulator [Aromatoleum diolicum]|uniref:histidine kinase n=1 Tax=Aromatoleum diolicum TaxID=75796 RepID=A0ABX1QGA7_9RHOO|nr:response regulator [Aromatoleum diolicum]NMG76045.1 response regulator [Aromatoleum diolicum]